MVHYALMKTGELKLSIAIWVNLKNMLLSKKRKQEYVWCELIYIKLWTTHKTKLDVLYRESMGTKTESHAWERNVPSYKSTMVSHHTPNSPPLTVPNEGLSRAKSQFLVQLLGLTMA